MKLMHFIMLGFVLVLLVGVSNEMKKNQNNNTNTTTVKFKEDKTKIKTTPTNEDIWDELCKKSTTTRLFLSYIPDIPLSKFNELTDILIDENKVKRDGDDLFYLFPSCSGKGSDQVKFHPYFRNDSLTSIVIDVDYGYGVTWGKVNGVEVPCILKLFMDKYSLDFKYDRNVYEVYSRIEKNNDLYDPKYQVQTNFGATDIYGRPVKPDFVEVPEYLIDKTKRLLPGEEKKIYYTNGEVPTPSNPAIMEQEDRLISIYDRWDYNLTETYSLTDTKEYHKLDLDKKIFLPFKENSKLVYIDTYFTKTVKIYIGTPDHYYRDRDSTKDIKKEDNVDESVQSRDISEEF